MSASINNRSSTCYHNHNRCLSIIEPDLSLLRNHKTARYIFRIHNGIDCIDRQQLQGCMYFPPRDIQNSLQFVYLIDQLRHIPHNQTIVSVSKLNSNMDSILSYGKLCKLHKHVLQASYYAQLSNKNFKRMCHLFSKVLPIRCQGRKFPIVALRYMKQYKTTYRSMLDLFVMSLLGNYPHIQPLQRPKSTVRARIYEIFIDNNNNNNTGVIDECSSYVFEMFIRNANLIIVNALREFILFSIDMHPWMSKHLEPLMHLKNFANVVDDCMSRVRKYFQMFLCNEASALYMCFDKNNINNNNSALHRVVLDLNQIMYPSHKLTLDISYRRPNLNQVSFIAATRKKCPLIKIPTDDDIKLAEFKTDDERLQYELERDIIAVMGEQNDEEDDNEDDEEEDEDVEDSMGLGIGSILKQLEHYHNNNKQDTSKKYEELDIWKYVNYSVYQALQAVVQRENPTITGCILRCLDWLIYFGINRNTIDYIKQVLLYYEYHAMSIEKLKKKLKTLQQYEPYAYTLVQLLAELIKQCERHYSWYQLPYHYLVNQVNALKNMYPITVEANAILESNVCLVFCDICGTDYSLIRVFANKLTGKKIYNQYYRLGFRDVVVDYNTNEMYCKRHKCNTKGKCGDKPLIQFPLLGRALWKDGKCYLICPQPNCGLKMEYDANQCIFTSYGVACADCTKKIKEHPPQYNELKSQYLSTTNRKCLLCNVDLSLPHSVYLLPAKDIYLCKKHAKSSIVKDIIERFGEDTNDINTDELRNFIIAKWKYNKLMYKDRNDDRNKKNLQIQKIKSQNRKVRR